MRKSSLVLLLALAVLVVPIAGFASHQFNDVPNSHTFHNAIDWMKDNNITVGCNPPVNNEYCPEGNVTRGQMAAFMKRLAENRVVDADTASRAATAANAEALGGVAPAGYQGWMASNEIFETLPPASTPTDIGGVDNFEVPERGGVLFAQADFTLESTFSGDVAIVWLEFDRNGLCSSPILPQSAAVHIFDTDVLATFGVSALAPVNAGRHRVDLCALTNGDVSAVLGTVTLSWVEGGTPGVAGTDTTTGPSPAEKLAELETLAGSR